MKISPLQPHSSWYRRFWYNERSPLERLVDRVLIFVIIVLSLVAIGTTLDRQGAGPRHSSTSTAAD